MSLVSMCLCRWGAGPVQWSICGVRTWPVDSLQFQGQPPCCTKWPTTCQTRVRLFHQNMGAGLHRDGGNALLLPPQHHQGTLRAIPAGDGPGNSWSIQHFYSWFTTCCLNILAFLTSADLDLMILIITFGYKRKCSILLKLLFFRFKIVFFSLKTK